jgi:hypothetical protein
MDAGFSADEPRAIIFEPVGYFYMKVFFSLSAEHAFNTD